MLYDAYFYVWLSHHSSFLHVLWMVEKMCASSVRSKYLILQIYWALPQSLYNLQCYDFDCY